jgi:hypothetical protein
MSPIRRASRSSGWNAGRSSAALATSIATSPSVSTAASVNAIGQLTVIGDTPRTIAATTSSAAFVTNTRQNSDIRLARQTHLHQPPSSGA